MDPAFYDEHFAQHRVNLTGQNDAPGKLPPRWASQETLRYGDDNGFLEGY